MWFQLIIILILLLIYLIYKTFNYWKVRGLDTPDYHYVVGNILEQILLTKNLSIIIQDTYNAFKGYNYYGFYNATQPAVVIRNPELIGTIVVKDFSSFGENTFQIDEKVDPIFGKNPFNLKGERWKQVRSQVTPSFTTGRIKTMLPLINETSTKFLNYMEDKENIALDAHQLAKRITSENVASCAFGVHGGSFTEDNAKFMEMSNKIFNPTPWNALKLFVITIIPGLQKYMKIQFFVKETVEFITSVITQTMQHRKENNIERNDFLEEMEKLKAKINDEELFNFSDILAHAGGFLLDGIETTAAVLNNGFYELAAFPKVQQKLREEIKQVLKKYNNEVTYEAIQEMEYLDCVFKEILRRHPPLMALSKNTTKPYTLPPMREDKTGPEVKLDVGTAIFLPLYALHHDPKYFPEPEKFIPERFSPENKDKIVKFTYMPFGEGPRVCLGRKFGILQTKVALITAVNNFKITVNNKTKEPIEIDAANFFNAPVGGYWVEFSKL